MKASIFLLIMSALLLGSCSADDDGLKSVEVSGRLVSELTGLGIANGLIYARVDEYRGSGYYAFPHEVSSTEIQTDENGYFTVILNFKDKENVCVFEQINEQIATSMLQERKTFRISELEIGNTLNFVARKYEQLQVKLKSIAPFDENDAVGLSFIQNNTNFHNSIIYRIENFGDQNQLWGLPAGDDGLNPYWIGDSVDSVIYGHIQEGTSVKVRWSVRKNGIVNEYHSDFFETVSGEVNFYDITY